MSTPPACDHAVAASAKGVSTRHPRLVLAATILASSLAFVDGSVVNVGLPAIGRSFQGQAGDLQWVVNAYLLPLSALLLLGGALGDRFGRRAVLVLGVTLFALASAACALAPSLVWLLAGRAAQGIGAALLLPNSLAILGGSFEGEARGRAIGVWAATGAGAGAIGPVLGGWLIDTVGWPAIFLINLPLAAGAILLALRYVEQEKRTEKPAALDLPGAVTVTAALAGLTWGLTVGSGPQSWTVTAIAAVVAGAGLLAAFVLIEKTRGDRAMMPLALFGGRSFVGLSLLTLLLYGVLSGLLLLLPYVLIDAAGYSATKAGAALLPFPLLMAVASPLMGGLAGRIGSRWLLGAGSFVVGAGVLLTLRLDAQADYLTTVLPIVLVVALGMTGVAAPLTTAVLSAVDARHTAAASGFNSALARIGGLVITALLGVFLAGHGEALIASVRAASVIGAVIAVLAGLCAVVLIDPKPKARA
jgi:EmrB/QacA subfamily drug resistance transporter